MLSEILKIVYLITLFLFQILLLVYILLATMETQRVAANSKLRLLLERKIEVVNSVLHWYFTFYAVFSIPIAAISFYFITSSQTYLVIFSIFIIILQSFQGIILIYLLRNHRFAENNSFKRRFAVVQMFNYALSYALIFLQYTVGFDLLKYAFGLLYACSQLVDQFYSCPYRDPFREPSLKVALILLSCIIVSFIFYAIDIND